MCTAPSLFSFMNSKKETGGRQSESNLPGSGCRPQPGLKPGRATGRDCLPELRVRRRWPARCRGGSGEIRRGGGSGRVGRNIPDTEYSVCVPSLAVTSIAGFSSAIFSSSAAICRRTMSLMNRSRTTWCIRPKYASLRSSRRTLGVVFAEHFRSTKGMDLFNPMDVLGQLIRLRV